MPTASEIGAALREVDWRIPPLVGIVALCLLALADIAKTAKTEGPEARTQALEERVMRLEKALPPKP